MTKGVGVCSCAEKKKLFLSVYVNLTAAHLSCIQILFSSMQSLSKKTEQMGSFVETLDSFYWPSS